MAKKKITVNKSQAIRDYVAKHDGAKPREVSAAIGKKGVSVTPQQVSTVLFQQRKKSGAKPGKSVIPKPTGDTVSLEALVQASDFIKSVGGESKAKQLLAALAKLDKS